ncbi:sigma-70 family RNA polymerase sigma factor [Bacillus paranthracis]|uniref:sigma factor-like helix-turn-helix DNA-binding protein n=1 Tax=Bacillus cereus group TaxID=86661 RepID=UPI001F56FF3A|nr:MULTISPECIES: sigma factor-like helix-turn-helix DNA-binding protein [Bacillus cereus group]MCU5390763.1 sigma-70 family RNA polymerase sigma factor [Bacillus paranthracis]MDA2143490.1 sigma factor-like helix-turn-helix DNA-binding protein [Bacillus cereus group sp. Bc248]MDA2171425.1 sigma factor-like helix-turn-helix DNA-binding protein [Bacillus cereus group sp. Bc247]
MVCLKDYQMLEEEITYLEYKLNRIHAELKRQSKWGQDILSINTGNEETEKILDQLRKKLTFKQEQLQRLDDILSNFKNLEQQILKLKYIEGMTLEGIGSKLNYSTHYIKVKHAEIMRRIKFAERLKAGG